jgi:membrane protein
VLDRLRQRARRWAWLRLALDVQERFGQVSGGYLASAITLAAFLSIFPLLLVASAVLGVVSGNRPDLAAELIDALGIPPGSDAADALEATLEAAESSKAAASVIGLAGMLWTGLGVVAALQYAYNAGWQVEGRGLRDKLFGLLWLAGASVLFVASFALTSAMALLPGFFAPVNLLFSLAVSFGLFLWAAKVLPNLDVGWRALLPGAALGAAGFQVLSLLGGIWVPRLVASSSAVYGSIGVVFAILAWLLLFGRVVVYANVVNVVLWERTHGTHRLDVEVPALPEEDGHERDARQVR